jgi:hypothetical protein
MLLKQDAVLVGCTFWVHRAYMPGLIIGLLDAAMSRYADATQWVALGLFVLIWSMQLRCVVQVSQKNTHNLWRWQPRLT